MDPFVDPDVHKTMMSMDIYPPSSEFHIDYEPESRLDLVYFPNMVTLSSDDKSISFPFFVHPELGELIHVEVREYLTTSMHVTWPVKGILMCEDCDLSHIIVPYILSI